jgi:predicted pyridoxine 5'-phosphate oxidase superfamily flavin-nucleotide-binding protein
VSEDARAVGRGIGTTISAGAAHFLERQRVAVASSADRQGRVWASFLTGPPGFARSVDPEILWLSARPHPGDPVRENLKSAAPAGILVFDARTRQRMRFNGRGVFREEGLFVNVAQVYGNCPKYIQLRGEEPDGPEVAAEPTVTTRALHSGQSARIEASDTFFIASVHPEAGADASHRGGLPGFVRVESPDRTSFPDYPGNAMFNTLGNLLVNPRAGLLFVDFTNGDVLQLTGRACVHAEDRRVTFEIDEARETRHASSLRLRLLEYSRSHAALDTSHDEPRRHLNP